MNWQIAFILLVVIAVCILVCQKHGGIINTIKGIYLQVQRWQMAQERKNRKAQIQADISTIRKTKERALDKKINLLTKPLVKKQFEESKDKINQYVQFCESKNLALEPDEEELLDTIRETEDLLDPSKAIDRDLQRAVDEYNAVYAEVNSSGENLLSSRQESAETIEKIESLINSIARCPKEFAKDVKEIKVHRAQFNDALEFGRQQQKALKLSAEGVGAGVATGAAIAGLAPTAFMWVATTFGTASTGTAISALSGAAATNAALAWLGGGALAAGGAGMAAGKALLALAGPVGWGVAGGSTLVGVFLLWKKNQKIQEDKRKEVVRIKNCTAALKTLKSDMDEIAIQTCELKERLEEQLSDCSEMEGEDYRQLSEEQKDELGAMVNNTKSLAMLLSKVFTAEESNDNGKRKGRFFKK